MRKHLVFRLLLLSCSLFFGLLAHAAFPPEYYVIEEGSKSPDERYAIMVPSREAAEIGEAADTENYLVDLKKKSKVGRIRCADYHEGASRKSLNVEWADDAKWCVVEYGERWGFAKLAVLELDGGKLRETEIGSHVQKMLDAALQKQSHSKNTSGEATTFQHLQKERKVQIRAAATTNPKGTDETGALTSFFQGTYDVAGKKWTASQARIVKMNDYYTLVEALMTVEAQGEGSVDDADRARRLDEKLNSVYQGLRLALPPARFAAVKTEQVAWLQAQKAGAPASEVCAAWEKRIEALQEYFW